MKPASTFRALAGALSLATLAACSQLTGADRLPVDFATTELHPAGTPAFAAGSGAPGTVTIHGTYAYGGCDTPHWAARADGADLVFRLEVRHVVKSGQACPAYIVVAGYRADITGVSPGTYHVRVEHAGMFDMNDFGPTGVPVGDGVRLESDVAVR